MENKSKILLSCPIYSGKEYITERYLKRISELTYDNYEILLVDTSENNDFAKKIKDKGFNVVKLRYEEDSRIAICNARNYIRDYFLKGDYTHYFTLEQDLIPQKDIIEQLLKHDKDIVSGWYYITNIPRPNIIKGWTMYEMKFLPKPMIMRDLADNELFKVFAGSFGCSLIKREVLEEIKFRVYKGFPHHDDSWFYFDCEREGFEVYVDTSLLIPHFQDYIWDKIIERDRKNELEYLIPKEIQTKYNEVDL